MKIKHIQITLYILLSKIGKFSSIAFGLCLFFVNIIPAQPCKFSVPCRELTGPVFPGGSTLCETVTGFDPDYDIRNNTYASALPWTIWGSGTVFNSVDILIEGVFYIDEPTEFINCRIKLASCAQIIVKHESFRNDILAFHCKLFSCDNMWKGIVLEDGTRCRLYSNSIEDAQYAVTVGVGVSLALYGNTFNRNFVGLTNSEESTSMSFLLFKNNTFDCTSELNDYCNLDFTCCHEDMVSFASVLLNNCSSSLGFYGSRNRFNNLTYGILANGSTVNIKGCSFKDSQHFTVIPDLVQVSPMEGCGIAGINSSVFMTGNEENRSGSFENSDLNCVGSALSVSFATLEDGSIGVDNNYNGEIVMITDNSLSGTDRGGSISVRRGASSGEEAHTYISRDTLMFTSPSFIPLYGIHLNGRLNPTDLAYVDHNIIKSSGTSIEGIRFTVWNSDNNRIEDNFIQFSSTDDKVIGIYPLLGATKSSVIAYDTIIGGNTFDAIHDSYGINAWAASGITYCSNRTNNLGYGLAFKGNCNNSNISINDLDVLGIGLYLSDAFGVPGTFGNQVGVENSWEHDGDEYTPYAAQNESILDPLVSSMYVIRSDDAGIAAFNPDNVEPSEWFVIGGDDDEICSYRSLINGYDSLIITNATAYSGLSDATKFYLEKMLLYKILENEDWSDVYSTFLSAEDDKSEFALANVELNLKQALQMDLTDQADLDDLRDDITSLYDSIFVYNAYNYAHIDSSTFTEGSYRDSLISKLAQIWDLTEDQHGIQSARMSTLISDLTDIDDNLDLITPRGTFDENYITIYKLFIKQIVDGGIDPGDYDDLNDIAQNFDDGSFANATAFAMFDLCSDHPYPDMAFNCEEEPVTERSETQKENNVTVINSVPITRQISFNLNSVFTGNILIFDLMGNCVYSSYLSDQLGNIKLDNRFAPGVYFYRFQNNMNVVCKSGLITVIE